MHRTRDENYNYTETPVFASTNKTIANIKSNDLNDASQKNIRLADEWFNIGYTLTNDNYPSNTVMTGEEYNQAISKLYKFLEEEKEKFCKLHNVPMNFDEEVIGLYNVISVESD